MSNEKLKRKDFLKSIAGIRKKSVEVMPGDAPGDPDELFEKYSRKTLGGRQYSERIERPDPNGPQFNRVGNVTSGLAPYTGAWTEWEAAHLLRRVSFGVRKTDLDTLLAMTLSDAVDALMNFGAPTLPSATALNNYQNTLPDSGGIAYGASWTSNNLTYTNPDDGNNNALRQSSLNSWNWGLCLNDATSIREKMV